AAPRFGGPSTDVILNFQPGRAAHHWTNASRASGAPLASVTHPNVGTAPTPATGLRNSMHPAAPRSTRSAIPPAAPTSAWTPLSTHHAVGGTDPTGMYLRIVRIAISSPEGG